MVQYLESNTIELLLKGLFKDSLLYPRVTDCPKDRWWMTMPMGHCWVKDLSSIYDVFMTNCEWKKYIPQLKTT